MCKNHPPVLFCCSVNVMKSYCLGFTIAHKEETRKETCIIIYGEFMVNVGTYCDFNDSKSSQDCSERKKM